MIKSIHSTPAIKYGIQLYPCRCILPAIKSVEKRVFCNKRSLMGLQISEESSFYDFQSEGRLIRGGFEKLRTKVGSCGHY